jgi:ABC-type multidrug transport system ATPase subunit
MTDRLTEPARRGAVVAELLEASKTFGTGAAVVQAVAELDLAVRAGELVAVLGPNGAGKTTALSMLTGMSRPAARHGSSAGTRGTWRRGSGSA